MKTHCVFFSVARRDRAQLNARRYPWAAQLRDTVIARAKPYLQFSDEALRGMMFDANRPRSWMVYSNGFCPLCKHPVPMYTWIIDPFKNPWKCECPHCHALFPNEQFPDDGNGYVEGEHRWRFIGTYLIYGQWKQLIVCGIKYLAEAYVVTSDREYARRATILLASVAERYPQFDFGKQGWLFEQPAVRGYVSTWHDACEEFRHLALAYDQIFDTIDDPHTREKIETNILRETISHREKIQSNFPRTDVAVLTARAILEYQPTSPAASGFAQTSLVADLDEVIERATKRDGLTGEKGLTHYARHTMNSLASLLAMFDSLDQDFLRRTFEKHPNLRKTFRFHIDTRCLGKLYPNIGDCGKFPPPREDSSHGREFVNASNNKEPTYKGVDFHRPGLTIDLKSHSILDQMDATPLAPSMFTFFNRLHEITGDPAYVQILHEMNDFSTKNLPWDLFAESAERFQTNIAAIIKERGSEPKLESINFPDWHLAILRRKNAALWIDYDVNPKAGHAHFDGMNIGLFAHGQDLLPDFGYPPVQFAGGWTGEKHNWYLATAAHNTVVVDGKNQSSGFGKLHVARASSPCPGPAEVQHVHYEILRASCPEMINGSRYDRTLAIIDIDEENFYILDIFRVTGGHSHTKCVHSQYGPIATSGLNFKPGDPLKLENSQLANFRTDPSPGNAWSVTWNVNGVPFRYIDLTEDVQVYVADAWISPGGFNETKEAYIPQIMVHREGSEPLDSTFISIMEPSNYIRSVSRDANQIAIILTDGCQHVVVLNENDIHVVKS